MRYSVELLRRRRCRGYIAEADSPEEAKDKAAIGDGVEEFDNSKCPEVTSREVFDLEEAT
jgi:hypothetical protein